MSFDLKIASGDLVIENGDFQKVENTNKLVQDVLKIIITPLGGNPFFPFYGSLIGSVLPGSVMDYVFIESAAEGQIRSSLTTLQNLQDLQQSSSQPVSASELLAAVKSVTVRRNDIDPTIFSISVNILSRALRESEVSFEI